MKNGMKNNIKNRMNYTPKSVLLYKSREYQTRIAALNDTLNNCNLCPRNCHVNRYANELGFCKTGTEAWVASYGPHFGEEPILVGTGGSGTIFFGYCNLACVYCQNHQISQPHSKHGMQETSVEELAEIMLNLQNQGCENINWVTPTHVIPQAVEALFLAIEKGLCVPIVYNSGGYEAVSTLKLLEGIIDIYMPDFKYFSEASATTYSNAVNYVAHAMASLKEMIKQTGRFTCNEKDVAETGVILRHLVLPNHTEESKQLFHTLSKEISTPFFLSVMAQYYPTFKTEQFPAIHHTLTHDEYQKVVDYISELGFEEGWIQDVKHAPFAFQPDFDEKQPFKEHT